MSSGKKNQSLSRALVSFEIAEQKFAPRKQSPDRLDETSFAATIAVWCEARPDSDILAVKVTTVRVCKNIRNTYENNVTNVI